jgi:hypothetical protein
MRNPKKWNEYKSMSKQEIRDGIDKTAKEFGVNPEDGAMILSLLWVVASRFYPEVYNVDPAQAFNKVLLALAESIQMVPKSELREIAEGAIDLYNETQRMMDPIGDMEALLREIANGSVN